MREVYNLIYKKHQLNYLVKILSPRYLQTDIKCLKEKTELVNKCRKLSLFEISGSTDSIQVY